VFGLANASCFSVTVSMTFTFGPSWLVLFWFATSATVGAVTFGQSLAKFSTQLSGPPPVLVPDNNGDYIVYMSEFTVQMLPAPYGPTRVFGYVGNAKDGISGAALGLMGGVPGPTFDTTSGQGFFVRFVNNITNSHLFLVDPTLHWANPNGIPMPLGPTFASSYALAQSPVPLVPHLHGGEVNSDSDGHPEAWFTYNGLHGPQYNTRDTGATAIMNNNSALFYYPNQQQPLTTWVHDHTLGMTRLNVYAGLACFYLIRSNADTVGALLPTGRYDMPLLVQDRTFDPLTGELTFPTVGVNPTVHPYWRTMFIGTALLCSCVFFTNIMIHRGCYYG
jgi:spore coat protein A